MAEQNEVNADGGWGWEPLGSEDDNAESADIIPQMNQQINHSYNKDDNITSGKLKKNMSEKSFSKKNATNITGITSSPSFQELERAIGQTLALNTSSTDINEMGNDYRLYSPGHGQSGMQSRYSSTNLTQQKVLSQRMRQQYQNQRGANFAQYRQHSYGNISVLGNTKAELSPFINESESRALIIFHSPNATQVAIRDACAKFGVLYYIRPDFHSRGVTFISYFDLQAAIAAKTAIAEGLGSDADVSVHYSVMLHATNSNTEEYKLVVKNLPEGAIESNVQSIFSRYGQLRSIQKTFGSSINLSESAHNVPLAYTIEYFNIQDARLAASELSATSATVWGPDTSVTFAPLDDRKQTLCKQLLATLSRWRSEAPIAPISPITIPVPPPMQFAPFQQIIPGVQIPPPSPIAGMGYNSSNRIAFGHFGVNTDNGAGMLAMTMPSPIQMVIPPGPPNLYSTASFAQHPMNSVHNPYAPHLMGTKLDTNPIIYNGVSVSPYYRVPHYSSNFMSATIDNETNENTQNDQNTPTEPVYHAQHHSAPARQNKAPENSNYSNGYANNNGYAKRNNNKGQQGGHGGNDGSADNDFTLNLEKIRNGQELRTTIMVRNIPNKYNQQMLLEEVNAHHKGTYDFFYLPIDFKNRCNVGYCFINFLEPKFIAPFVEEFNGQRWKSFNSEKICAVSFARIQGKSAMISRFQNSSLLEKDEEYKPLLFYSSGPDKGNPEPFPISNRVRQSNGESGFHSPHASNEGYSRMHSHHNSQDSNTENITSSDTGTPTL